MVASVPTGLTLFVSALLWGAIGLSLVTFLFWAYETTWLGRRRPASRPAHSLEAVQCRILTVDAVDVVQRTVDSIPAAIDDVHVIAEEPMTVEGAVVHVVPDDFSCEATRKGRALEWARQHVDCESEFVLYLDEDSLVSDLDGIPDADVVQFREQPSYTGSLLTYLAEILRMGYQVEQRAFGALRYPLYTWGGGVAVRSSLESQVGWNVDTLVEDTVFAWTAARSADVEFCTADAKFANQAPPSIREMVEQRRRWVAGAHRHSSLLSPGYRLLVGLRNTSWALVAVVPLSLVLLVTTPAAIAFENAYFVVSMALFGVVALIGLVGVRYYDESLPIALLLLGLLPIVGILHSLGALLGLLVPPTEFKTTTKIDRSGDRVDSTLPEGSTDGTPSPRNDD